MQKNIISAANHAFAEETGKTKKTSLSEEDKRVFTEIRQELDSLKQENLQFAAAVDEMKAQNEELKNKIEKILSKPKKKKSTRKTK
jgi:predicted RNase H-like nuclease (RuvC/YqgF family)